METREVRRSAVNFKAAPQALLVLIQLVGERLQQ